MGLGAFKWYWQHQTKNFGHDQGSRYPCPIFDNRGMGESDKPLAWYSTSGMAEGSLELLQHLETTMERQLHFIGISMGGTIAQELVNDSLKSYIPYSSLNIVRLIGHLNELPRSRSYPLRPSLSIPSYVYSWMLYGMS